MFNFLGWGYLSIGAAFLTFIVGLIVPSQDNLKGVGLFAFAGFGFVTIHLIITSIVSPILLRLDQIEAKLNREHGDL